MNYFAESNLFSDEKVTKFEVEQDEIQVLLRQRDLFREIWKKALASRSDEELGKVSARYFLILEMLRNRKLKSEKQSR